MSIGHDLWVENAPPPRLLLQGNRTIAEYRIGSVMEERFFLVRVVETGGGTALALAKAWGIHRNTIRNWRWRYRYFGFDGLIDGRLPGGQDALEPVVEKAAELLRVGSRRKSVVALRRAPEAERGWACCPRVRSAGCGARCWPPRPWGCPWSHRSPRRRNRTRTSPRDGSAGAEAEPPAAQALPEPEAPPASGGDHPAAQQGRDRPKRAQDVDRRARPGAPPRDRQGVMADMLRNTHSPTRRCSSMLIRVPEVCLAAVPGTGYATPPLDTPWPKASPTICCNWYARGCGQTEPPVARPSKASPRAMVAQDRCRNARPVVPQSTAGAPAPVSLDPPICDPLLPGSPFLKVHKPWDHPLNGMRL